MSISITRLEKWDYKREYQIFRDLYKATRKTEWIRIPALIATEKCIAIRTAALVGTIAGLTFNGLRFTLAPYQSFEQRHHGWILLKNVPYKGLRLIGGILLGIVVCPIWISIDPKNFIQEITRQTEVDFNHAEAGTIDTEAHEHNLENASL